MPPIWTAYRIEIVWNIGHRLLQEIIVYSRYVDTICVVKLICVRYFSVIVRTLYRNGHVKRVASILPVAHIYEMTRERAFEDCRRRRPRSFALRCFCGRHIIVPQSGYMSMGGCIICATRNSRLYSGINHRNILYIHTHTKSLRRRSLAAQTYYLHYIIVELLNIVIKHYSWIIYETEHGRGESRHKRKHDVSHSLSD